MSSKVEGWLWLVKVFVVVAGITLVAGTALLLALLVQRASRPMGAIDQPRPLTLPVGMRLVELTVADDALVLTLADPQGVPHVLVVERDRGQVLAFWKVETRP